MWYLEPVTLGILLGLLLMDTLRQPVTEGEPWSRTAGVSAVTGLWGTGCHPLFSQAWLQMGGRSVVLVPQGCLAGGSQGRHFFVCFFLYRRDRVPWATHTQSYKSGSFPCRVVRRLVFSP